jgi:hypothetical protein
LRALAEADRTSGTLTKSFGGYVVRDANGQAFVYVYSRDNEAEALQAKVLTKDEARRIAVNVALLPQATSSGGPYPTLRTRRS